MNLREVILGLLMERPMHAYALKQVLAPRMPPSMQINDGVLYPLLGRMAADGLVAGRLEPGRNNKPRQVYAVTEAGRAHFRAWLESGAEEADEAPYDFFMGHPFLVKVQFFGHLSSAQRTSKLRTHLERTTAKLRQFGEILDGMRERRADAFRIELLELGVAQQKATQRWLRRRLRAAPEHAAGGVDGAQPEKARGASPGRAK